MGPKPHAWLWRMTTAACLMAALGLVVPGRSSADDRPASLKKPKVEVVFCLDTTGSMGGLIEGAKQKIWSISNQIASGRPVPDPGRTHHSPPKLFVFS